MFSCRHNRKKILIAIGICLLTGSFCACGDDTSVIITAEDLRIQEEYETPTQVPEVHGEPESERSEVPGESEPERSEVPGESESERSETSGELTPSPQSEVISITISAVGDVTLGNYPEQVGYSLHQVYDEVRNDAYFFENVYDIFSGDDMTIVNLEGVLTNATEKKEGQTYNLKGRPEYVNILKSGSIEAVGMANNHRLDYMEQGSNDTAALLEEAAIAYAYDDNIGIYEVKGVKIGFISVNEVGWGAGVEKLIQNGIAKLREQQADIILVSCHWGIEREYYPEDYQQILGRKCIDWGADLVIGHHPHVLQGVEEYGGKYIVYSLGNFCFGANRNPDDKDTMIFQQTFTFIEGEKQEDQNIRVIPCSVSSVSGLNDFKPTPATGDEATRIMDKINEYSRDFGVQFDAEGYNLLNGGGAKPAD